MNVRLVLAPIAAALALSAAPARGQGASPLTRADSALVGRILLAEDRRDSTDAALGEGESHPDPRVRTLAQRARGRIRDPQYSARDSLPSLRPPPIWVEPAWRVRYRALVPLRDDCIAMRLAMMDSVWAVRLRAVDLLRESCATDDVLVARVHALADSLPTNAAKRRSGQVSWHAAAHAIVALARLRPAEAGRRLSSFSHHRTWEVRQYIVRAAAIVGDTALLRRLARDRNDNVSEVAIEALARITGHADDTLFVSALERDGAQVVRAAAIALQGTTLPGAAATANRAFERFVARANASERDARVALLEAAGRSASEDRPPPVTITLPRDAIALALGAEVKLRVTLDRESGGGTFVVRLRGDVAPMMASRVLAIAQRGGYDGLTFHRVEHDFVIQGLGPGANEYVGAADFFRDELGTVSHVRGTVGMSTRGHDTGDAQWFVNLKDNARLDRDYTVFAEVVVGIGVVDGILEGDRVQRIRRIRR